MERHALVIEDQKEVLEGAIDQILSIGDNCEVVSNQLEAEKFFFNNREMVDYIVCELNMLARPNSPSPSCQNGIRFLKKTKRTCNIPFFMMASCALVCQGYSAKAMKNGANDFVAYPLPPMGRPLGRVIEKTFDSLLPGLSDYMADHPLQKLDGGIVNLTRECVEINTIPICDYQELSGAGMIFVKLSEIAQGNIQQFVSARTLAKLLGVSLDTFFMIVLRLRDRIVLRMKEANILCEPKQVIKNYFNHGYFLAPEFEICDNRNAGSSKPATAKPNESLFRYADISDERELWILEQLCRGKKLKRQDVEKQFSVSAKTASRLLMNLRRRGIIEFCGNSNQGYWKMVDSQKAAQCAVFYE